MGDYLKLYLLTIPVFIGIDMIWLGWLSQDLYKGIEHLRGPVNWTAAAVFYAIFIVGILFFGTRVGLEEKSWQLALLYGGLFGFFTYATYDMTNWATLRDWPVKIVICDVIWGTILCGSVASIAYLMGDKWLGM